VKHRILQLLKDNRAAAGRRADVVRNDAGSSATIYLYDAIVSDEQTAEYWGGVAAQQLVPQIAALDVQAIHLRINSPGGDVFAAQAIAQAIRESKATVIAHIDGLAASAASVIMVAADEVEIAPGGFVMIHQAWTIALGNASDLIEVAAMLEKVDGSIANQYATRAGGELDMWSEYMKAETWFSADEAVAAGLADRVTKGATADASLWNLSAYDKPPRATAPKAEPCKAQQLLQESLRAARMTELITRGV
jgi:ATP-dependent Clp protease, protease subunit